MKNKEIHFRATEQEYSMIKSKAQKANVCMSEYLIQASNKCEIKIISDLVQMQTQLRYIGNNLNQLTKLCHEGRIECLDLNGLKKEVGGIWQLLNLLIQSQN